MKTHYPEKQACDSRVSRKEFLTTLVRRASLAGALLAAPKIVDKFLIPPAYALTSTTHLNDTSSTADTNHFHDVKRAFILTPMLTLIRTTISVKAKDFQTRVYKQNK